MCIFLSLCWCPHHTRIDLVFYLVMSLCKETHYGEPDFTKYHMFLDQHLC